MVGWWSAYAALVRLYNNGKMKLIRRLRDKAETVAARKAPSRPQQQPAG